MTRRLERCHRCHAAASASTGHLPDVTIVAPIFSGDRLVARSGSVAHMVE
ncbi:MAG: hydantoinase B/oxoprolinase family protein [Burkholderiales bacterium]|nr:hydantoinase B/oxoprolinase family protein [Burkholderiales bacterium]